MHVDIGYIAMEEKHYLLAISDSTVVLCRDGSGCLYAVIQTKSRATPEQDQKLANEVYHNEAGTKQCIYITLLHSESASTRR